MNNVYAIQLSNWYPSATLPQAIGTLWSYAQQFESINNSYKMVKTFWENENAQTVIDEIVDPDVILCSCYIWNWERTNIALKEIKNKYPQCLVIIGGPEPKYSVEWMQQHNHVDILIPYYGEEVLVDVLKTNLQTKDFLEVEGIITKDFYNRKRNTINLEEVPSPYLNGFFGNLVENKRDETRTVRCVFESNRGCPYSCTFCDIGSTAYAKVKKFGMHRVLDELEWIVKNGVTVIDVADANFGIFDRDEEIVDALIDLKKKHNWKGKFLPTWSKARGDRVLRCAKKLIHGGLDSIFGLSLQSLNQQTLDNVKRTNAFTLQEMSDIIKDMNESDIAVYTELVFPMPGDTYANFKSGMEELIDLPHTFNKFQINQLSKLNNAEFSSNEYNEKFEINWANIRGFTKHYHGDEFTDNICTSTSSMSEDDVFESLFLIKSFYKPIYFYGILQNTCNTLHTLGIEKRSTLINESYKFLQTKTWFNEHKQECKDHYFSAIKNQTHYGWNIMSDPLYFFPEYAISHINYLKNNIHDVLKERFPQYHELIDIDYYSMWKGTSQKIEYQVENYAPGNWTFSDSRETNKEDYYNTIYIAGRFDDRWKMEEIHVNN